MENPGTSVPDAQFHGTRSAFMLKAVQEGKLSLFCTVWSSSTVRDEGSDSDWSSAIEQSDGGQTPTRVEEDGEGLAIPLLASDRGWEEAG